MNDNPPEVVLAFNIFRMLGFSPDGSGLRGTLQEMSRQSGATQRVPFTEAFIYEEACFDLFIAWELEARLRMSEYLLRLYHAENRHRPPAQPVPFSRVLASMQEMIWSQSVDVLNSLGVEARTGLAEVASLIRTRMETYKPLLQASLACRDPLPKAGFGGFDRSHPELAYLGAVADNIRDALKLDDPVMEMLIPVAVSTEKLAHLSGMAEAITKGVGIGAPPKEKGFFARLFG